MGRADAGAELGDHAGRVAAEGVDHATYRGGDDAEVGALSSAMHAADRAADGIDEPDGAAVGDVDAEAHGGVVGDEGVHRRNRTRGLCGDQGDAAAVDLLGGHEMAGADSEG